VAWGSFVIWKEPSFQQCIGNQEKQETSSQSKNDPPKIAYSPLIYARIDTVCAGRWGFDNRDAITAVATIFIALFTLTLWWSTDKMWQEAKRAGEIAERAMVAGERAFVFPTGVLNPYWEIDAVSGLYNWRFRIEWRNSGETPTKKMRMNIECVLRDTELPRGFDFNYQTSDIGTALIPPQTTVLSGIAPRAPAPAITPQDILDVQAGRRWLYVYGWAKYFDVFPNTKEHVTRFCWIIMPMGNPMTFKPDVKDIPEPLRFPSVHFFEGNCADDECSQST
jgi:hypothetical protein